MKVFSFPYRQERARDGTLVLRPAATIAVQASDGKWLAFEAYADAGADITLLRKSDCEILGYPLEAGELRYMGGVCSGLIKTYLHKVPVRLETVEFLCVVAFAEKEEIPCLLGRADIFQRFRVCYDEQKRMTDFILREDKGCSIASA